MAQSKVLLKALLKVPLVCRPLAPVSKLPSKATLKLPLKASLRSPLKHLVEVLLPVLLKASAVCWPLLVQASKLPLKLPLQASLKVPPVQSIPSPASSVAI